MKKRSESSSIFSLLFLFSVVVWVGNVDTATGQPTTATQGNQTTKLRIAVPQPGFNNFVKIAYDSVNGTPTFSGFCIDVFRAVANEMLSSVSIDFVPYTKPDGTMNGTYDQMLQAVLSKEYDGAVGDITIRFSRMQLVDFTMPYTQSGVQMLVPLHQQSSTKKTGISLLPLIKGLLIGALALFVFTPLLFSLLDYMKNDDRQRQFPTVSNEEDRLRETLKAIKDTRLVMVLWFSVLLLLTTCYTASVTSLLTPSQARIPSKNLNQLLRDGDNVGYLNGSFVFDFLTEKGFSEKQLKPFNSEQQMQDLLSNGEVSAVIHETPYLQVFLANHCGDYALVPNFDINAEGFGFAFQQNSQWVKPVSEGILKLLDDGDLGKIQDRTVGSLDSCQGDTNGVFGFGLINSGIVIAAIVCCLFVVIILYAVYISAKCRITRQKAVNPRA